MPLLVIAFVASWAALFGGAQLVKEDETAEANGGPPPVVGPGPVQATIVAEGLAWDVSTLTANAGSDFTITIDNRDASVLHNIAFYTDASVSQLIFGSELFTGPDTQTSTFTAPSVPGNYFFRCDVHPDTMTGVFVVQ